MCSATVVLSGLPGTGPVGYHHTEVCAAGTESRLQHACVGSRLGVFISLDAMGDITSGVWKS